MIKNADFFRIIEGDFIKPFFIYIPIQTDIDKETKESEARRRQQLRKRYVNRNPRGVIGTPPPVKGRRHEQIQTEKYLEELFNHPPEQTVECQTDLYLLNPPIAPYIPTKSGVDVSTEIGDGDLFDFDTEVDPIVESLVGVSVEQALIELMHEEQVAEIRRQQQVFLAIREAEMAELRRLEADELHLQSEKEHRLKLEKISTELDQEMRERITAAKLIQSYVTDLLPGILDTMELQVEGKKLADLEDQLKPWLAQEVANEVGQMVDSRDILERMVREIVENRAAAFLQGTTDNSELMNGDGDSIMDNSTNDNDELASSDEVKNKDGVETAKIVETVEQL